MGKKKSAQSAGLLLYRRRDGSIEVFLAHPGGPFWRGRDEGAWTIPKGLVEPEEDPLDAAIREFREETGVEPRGPYLELGSIRQKGGKTVHGWAFEGEAEAEAIVSNLARLEWPRGSGRWISYPEIDRCGWFVPDEAERRLNPAQAEFVARLLERLSDDGSAPTV